MNHWIRGNAEVMTQRQLITIIAGTVMVLSTISFLFVTMAALPFAVVAGVVLAVALAGGRETSQQRHARNLEEARRNRDSRYVTEEWERRQLADTRRATREQDRLRSRLAEMAAEKR